MDPTLLQHIEASKTWLDTPDSMVNRALRTAGAPVKYALENIPEATRKAATDTLSKAMIASIDAADSTVRTETLQNDIHETLAAQTDAQPGVLVDLRHHAATRHTRTTTAAAFAGGFGTGTLGLMGLVADLPMLFTLQNRMAIQISTVWGHDARTYAERMLFLQLLGLPDTFGDARQEMVEQILWTSHLSKHFDAGDSPFIGLFTGAVARGYTPAAVRNALQRIIERQVSAYVAQVASKKAGDAYIATTLATNLGGVVLEGLGAGGAGTFLPMLADPLARPGASWFGQWWAQRSAPKYAEQLLARKALASVPVIGAVIGGTFNAWYTNRNADSMMQFYRLRYLCEHHGMYAEFGITPPDHEAVSHIVQAIDRDQLMDELQNPSEE